MIHLKRLNDNKEITANDYNFITFDEETKRGKKMDKEVAIGKSLILSPFNASFSWMTTEITSFEQDGEVLKFSTKNSNYELTTK